MVRYLHYKGTGAERTEEWNEVLSIDLNGEGGGMGPVRRDIDAY